MPSIPDAEESGSYGTPPHAHNYPWAELMRRVFVVDVLECSRCGGRMRIIAAIHPPETTRKILDCLSLPSQALPLVPVAFARDDPDLY